MKVVKVSELHRILPRSFFASTYYPKNAFQVHKEEEEALFCFLTKSLRFWFNKSILGQKKSLIEHEGEFDKNLKNKK